MADLDFLIVSFPALSFRVPDPANGWAALGERALPSVRVAQLSALRPLG